MVNTYSRRYQVASAKPKIRHVFGDTFSCRAAPPGNNIAQWSECIQSQKIQPFDWLDTLQCIQKLLYLVTSNRGPYQLIDWSRTPFYTKIFRRHNWIFGKFSVNCRWRSHLISKRGFPSDFHAYNRLFSVCKHNYGNYFLHIIVCSEISLTMAQEKDSLMSYWCKIRMFKTI